jgi:hypothetical protein
MSPMVRLILVKEYTKKKEDYESLLPPREGYWTPQIRSSYKFENENENENGERILC